MDKDGLHQTACQKLKRIGNPNTNSKNIQSRYRDRVSHRKCAMLVMKSDTGRSRTTKSSSHQNARRKGNLQILGNIGS